MSARIACPACGASIDATGACPYCGGSGALDGIAGRLRPSDLGCPRCEGAPQLQGLDHEEFHADVCSGCHGAWIRAGMLEEIVRTAAKRPPRKGESMRAPDHGALEPVRYARCPVCDGGMVRESICRKPLVIIDRCPSHGTWCDGGELGQLKLVARTQGADVALGSVARREREQREKEEKRLPPDAAVMIAEMEGIRMREEARRKERQSGSRRYRSGGRTGPDLFDILGGLFDLW